MSSKIFGAVTSETKAMVRQALKSRGSKKNSVAIIRDERSGMNYAVHRRKREVIATRTPIYTCNGELQLGGSDIIDMAMYKRGLLGFGKVKQTGRLVADMQKQTVGAIYSDGKVGISNFYNDLELFPRVSLGKIFNALCSWTRKGDKYVHRASSDATYIMLAKTIQKELHDATAGIL